MPVRISMTLFAGEADLSATAVETALAHFVNEGEPAQSVQAEGNTVSFRLDGLDVVVGLVPAPLPWPDLEHPCSNSVLWPAAEDEIRGHRRHAIVTVVGDASPLELMTTLTRATAIVLTAEESSLGVFWSSASLLIPKALFVDFAFKVLPNDLPLDIWISVRVGRNEDGSSVGYTDGMASFDLPDLESLSATDSPGELRDRFLNISRYLIEHGNVIEDGHTVGADERERVRVAEVESSFGLARNVLQLVYEAQDSRPMQ
jgi:hypothetical protein